VNLLLEVLGRRDDGYHEIDTVLQTLELADVVTLVPGGSPLSVQVTGPYATGTPRDSTNLAWRAVEELARCTGRHPVSGLTVVLEKNIPPAGGLGGGASDAATVLRLLQTHWPGIPDEMLFAAANAVGSDEAFFLLGGTCRATGRGETVTTLPMLPPRDVVLFVPPATIERKTARMFTALDALPFDPGGLSEGFVGGAPADFSSADVFNAFERVAFDVFDGLHDLWEQLESKSGAPIRLAGAGPTLFWIGSPGDGERIAESAQGAACAVVETRTARSLWEQ
jgi:4-diphosphocytidyl-2-C-methyl-D-erythritol kinase